MSNDWEDLPLESDCAGSKYTVRVLRNDDNREVTWVGIDWIRTMDLKNQYHQPRYEVTVNYAEDGFGEGRYCA